MADSGAIQQIAAQAVVNTDDIAVLQAQQNVTAAAASGTTYYELKTPYSFETGSATVAWKDADLRSVVPQYAQRVKLDWSLSCSLAVGADTTLHFRRDKYNATLYAARIRHNAGYSGSQEGSGDYPISGGILQYEIAGPVGFNDACDIRVRGYYV